MGRRRQAQLLEQLELARRVVRHLWVVSMNEMISLHDWNDIGNEIVRMTSNIGLAGRRVINIIIDYFFPCVAQKQINNLINFWFEIQE